MPALSNRLRSLLPTLCLLVAACSGDPLAELMEQLQSGDAAERQEAARALGDFGTEAVAAVPLLAEAVGDEDAEVRRLVCVSLGKIGSDVRPAMPALSRALEDPELKVRLGAAFALQKLDPAGRKFVPVLVSAMQFGDGGVIVAVGQMGGEAEWAVPALTGLLKDRRAGIRRLAAESLGQIGRAARPASSALRQATIDPNDRVREAARAAIERIQQERVE